LKCAAAISNNMVRETHVFVRDAKKATRPNFAGSAHRFGSSVLSADTSCVSLNAIAHSERTTLSLALRTPGEYNGRSRLRGR
jgi:hypothetical protein